MLFEPSSASSQKFLDLVLPRLAASDSERARFALRATGQVGRHLPAVFSRKELHPECTFAPLHAHTQFPAAIFAALGRGDDRPANALPAGASTGVRVVR